MSPARIARRPIGAAVGALALVAALAGPALGHAELDTADPADKAVLETPPTTITLTFTEDLDPAKSSFKLLASDGSTVGSGGATAIRTMSLDNLELAPGDYQIKWTSASAADGDIARGELTFTVAQPSASSSAGLSESDAPSASAAASPSASVAAAVTPGPSDATAPSPAPSAAPSAPAASTGDVVLPIVVGLILVGVVAAFVLRRSRGA